MKTNIFFRKRREMFIDKSELVTVLEVLNKHEITYADLANLKMGNCGWAKAPNCWFIMFSANDRTWYQILKEFKVKNITLLPETVRY